VCYISVDFLETQCRKFFAKVDFRKCERGLPLLTICWAARVYTCVCVCVCVWYRCGSWWWGRQERLCLRCCWRRSSVYWGRRWRTRWRPVGWRRWRSTTPTWTSPSRTFTHQSTPSPFVVFHTTPTRTVQCGCNVVRQRGVLCGMENQ